MKGWDDLSNPTAAFLAVPAGLGRVSAATTGDESIAGGWQVLSFARVACVGNSEGEKVRGIPGFEKRETLRLRSGQALGTRGLFGWRGVQGPG